MKRIQFILLAFTIVLGSLTLVGLLSAAPVATVMRSILPETDNLYYLGTTTPKTYWADVYTRGLTVSTGLATTTISSGSSTFANGISLTAGCFYVAGACLPSSAVSGTASANQVAYWDGASSIAGDTDFTVDATTGTLRVTRASTTLLSAYTQAAFGGTATSTFNSAGALTLITPLVVGSGGSGATSLTGLLQGNGTSAFTVITNSSTAGQVLRVTGASAYAWGAIDLDDTDAFTGTLPVTAIEDVYLLNTGDTGTGAYDFGGATTLIVPVSASSTMTTSGELEIDTTDSAVHFNSGGTTRTLPALRIFGFTLASTTSSEKLALPFTSDFAFTVSEVKAKMSCMATSTAMANCGGGYTFNLTHGASQNSTTTLFTAAINTMSTSTYTAFSSFADASVALDEEWFFWTSAATTSIDSIVVQVFGYLAP